jgi:hypothetical protein
MGTETAITHNTVFSIAANMYALRVLKISAMVIGVTVLADNGRHALRIFVEQAEADRRAVVEDVWNEILDDTLQPDRK